MQELLVELFREPTLDNFLRIRNQVMSNESFNPYSTDIGELVFAYAKNDFFRAAQIYKTSVHNLILSPCVHRVLHEIAKSIGDSELAELEAAVSQTCLDAILWTGNGTRERPYLVCRISDEYDVLAHIGAKKKGQRLQEYNEKLYDILELEMGGEIVFDITDIKIMNQRIWKRREGTYIQLKPHWIDTLKSMLGKAGDEGVIAVISCGYYRFDTRNRTISALAEWEVYPNLYNGLVFQTVCEKLGFFFIRNENTVTIPDPGLLVEWADLNLRGPSGVVVVHPGYFEGTWPEAERDFEERYQ